MSGPTLVPQAAYTRYVCTRCGVLESPCEHFSERWALEEIRKSLRVIEGGICEIVHLLNRISGFSVFQIEGSNRMTVTGVKLGGQGTFQETPLPPGSQLPAGVIPVWSTTDTLVTLTPSADGTSVVAAVAATDTNTSFPLTVTATLPDGTTPTGTVAVPILPVAVQVPTSFDINQTA